MRGWAPQLQAKCRGARSTSLYTILNVVTALGLKLSATVRCDTVEQFP